MRAARRIVGIMSHNKIARYVCCCWAHRKTRCADGIPGTPHIRENIRWRKLNYKTPVRRAHTHMCVLHTILRGCCCCCEFIFLFPIPMNAPRRDTIPLLYTVHSRSSSCAVTYGDRRCIECTHSWMCAYVAPACVCSREPPPVARPRIIRD